MRIYVIPPGVGSRPELAPLVDMKLEPGQRVAWHGPYDWQVGLRPMVSASAELALRCLQPVYMGGGE